MVLPVFSKPVSSDQIILSVILLITVVIIGIVFDKVLIKRLKTLTLKTKWEGDDILIGSLRTITFWLGLIAGIYLVSTVLPLLPEIQANVNKLVYVLITIWITIFAGRVLVGFIRKYSSENQGLIPSTTILSNVTKVAVFTLGFLVILQTLGISVTPMLTALGVGGLAVALALQPTLSNLFAGIQLLASKHVHPGDYVKLESGDKGYITDITWRSTSIRALPNRIIVIPNAKLASSIINNFTLPEKEIAVLVDMSVAYNSDLQKVERVTIEVATETMMNTTGGVSSFIPFIRFNTFGDSGIGFSVIMRAEEFVNQYLIKHEFIKAIHTRYKEENIEIPYPVMVVKTEH